MSKFEVRDIVEILGWRPTDPIIVQHRSCAEIAEVREHDSEAEYLITVDATMPPDKTFGPFPEERFRLVARRPR